MSNQKKQWGAIVIMIALFAMIALVYANGNHY